MTSPVTVRLARPEDYDAVAALLHEAYSASFWTTALYDSLLADVAGTAEEQDLWVVVGDREDAGEGFSRAGRVLAAVYVERGTHPGPDGAAELGFNRLGVAPRARGRGLGRLLVEHADHLAADLGAERLAIHSGPQMHDAHRMYERLGFVRVPEREDLVVDSGQRLLVYTRPVGGAAAGTSSSRAPRGEEPGDPVDEETLVRLRPEMADALEAALAAAPGAGAVAARDHWEALLSEADALVTGRRRAPGPARRGERALLALLLRYDQLDRPRLARLAGRVPPLAAHPALWQWARDVFAAPGAVTAEQLFAVGVLTDSHGRYATAEGEPQPGPGDPLSRWTGTRPAASEKTTTP